ncbi:MAG: hypothetical protein J07HQX50_02326 [Haloquadratum sp. J07HQX50]|nr:MAG: hypothetical protein J07HQX50_02326 [Haloquadratum sp. J07HQX50]
MRTYNPTHRSPRKQARGPSDEPVVQWTYQLHNGASEVAVWDQAVYVATGEGSSSGNLVALRTNGTVH